MALIMHMKKVGEEFLKSKCQSESIDINETRMGFHAPGHNSQDHLHLHLVIPPFKGSKTKRKKYDNKYGSGLVTIENVILRHRSS